MCLIADRTPNMPTNDISCILTINQSFIPGRKFANGDQMQVGVNDCVLLRGSH